MSRVAHAPNGAPLDDCIRTAVDLLLRRDGPSFSMKSLAQRAGVSRATLYRHLNGRRQLAELIAAARRAPSARQRLISAATRLVAAQGLNGFKLEDVAATAGVSATTLYREFAQRSDLLRAVIERIAPGEELVKLLAAHDVPPERCLPAFVAAVLRQLEEQPLFLRLMLLGDVADVAELKKLRRNQASVSQALASYLEAQVRAGRLRQYPLPRLTASLLGLILGAHRVSRLMPTAPATSLAESAQEIVEIYLAGTGEGER